MPDPTTEEAQAAALEAIAERMIAEHSRDLEPKSGRLGKVQRYLAGEHDQPYAPKGAKSEYKEIARKAITNWLPLISDTFSKGLFVDGYRPARAADNSDPWRYWQANGLDARQTIAHRGALEYGASYVLVLPGKPEPLIRPLSPLRVHALYADEDAEFPALALISRGSAARGDLYHLVDDTAVHTLLVPEGKDRPELLASEAHGLGVCPIVRFRERLDGDARGIVAPLVPIQDRINEISFSTLIAIQYASFRQRWATGLAVPVDEETGLPVEPFAAAIDRLWVTDSADAKFGDFAQTEVSGHVNTYNNSVRTMAAIAQTPPHVLMGEMSNLSADALAAAEASTQRKIGEYEVLFGEAWEQVFRLAALADGNTAAAADTSAEVRWRDTEARSLAATVDALGKMAQMLMVPPEALWERIPGVTDGDVERWREMAGQADGMAALADALTRQSAPAIEAAPPAPLN